MRCSRCRSENDSKAQFCEECGAKLELLAERDPEEARKILDPVLMRMIEAVHRYEGT
ncbi:MAG TPA: zinc ribbon domain-containing protein [Methylomirabilota bacterium]|jgi:predicted amidophosphoribosyltransferase